MYIKYNQKYNSEYYKNIMTEDDILLMSNDDFENKDGKNIIGVPTCINKDGIEPLIQDDMEVILDGN